MDYGELLNGAWRVVWRHRYLWLLGLFAGGGGFAGCGSPGGQNYRYDVPSGSFGGNLEEHLPLIFGLAALALLVVLVLAVISVAATAGLVTGTDAAYRGAPIRAREAWRQGWSAFWRLLGLWLLVGVVVTAVVLLLVAVVAIPPVVSAVARDGGPSGWAILYAVGAGLVALLVLLVGGVAVSIALQWALRALVLDGAGIVDSLRRSAGLLRSRPGRSLGVWGISLGLSLVIGLVVGGAVLAAAVPAILIGVAAWRTEAAAVWAFVPLAALLALVVFGLLKAVSSTFFSAYWTIAYLHLTEELAGIAAGPQGKLSAGREKRIPAPYATPAGSPIVSATL